MRKLSLLNLVNQYIDDEKKRRGKTLSKSAIYQWIKGDVDDELTAINDEYNLIVEKNNKEARIIFGDSIKAQFKTNYFQDFLLNKSKPTEDYYKKFLEECSISEDAIKGFFNPESGSNTKTLDFFTAFCKHQEREFGKKELIPTHLPNSPFNSKDIKSELFEISGATIINEDFINKVKSGKAFTMPDFYGAKQNNNCQWYGIINDFDVIREGYVNLQRAVLDSFKEEKDFKVSAIVYGYGGAGKSTVLRRLAIDFYAESFDVVWLEKGKIKEFVEQGLSVVRNLIEKNEVKKFLIVIEDWYRMFDDENKIKLGVQILEESYGMNNIRIVIGDRSIQAPYNNCRNNDFEMHLSSKDNKEIIGKIIEKYPIWKMASEKLLDKDKNYPSSLFLLLFILARIDQKVFKNETLNLLEPQQVFQNIILSDLKFIADKYIGLAKALYYWGCCYSKYRTFTSYSTFLKIADFYQNKGDREISDLFIRWNCRTPFINRLKIYINIDEWEFLDFNHEILVDLGLSKLNIEKEDKFCDETKLEILKIIICNETSSLAPDFLCKMLAKEGHIFKNRKEKINYVKELICKNNMTDECLEELIKIDLGKKTLTEFANLLWEKKMYFNTFWSKYFEIIQSDEITNNILQSFKIEDIAKYDPEFTCTLLKYQDITIRKTLTDSILMSSDWVNIDCLIILECLKNATHKTKKSFSTKILQDYIWKEISISIIEVCFEVLTNKDKRIFSDKVLQDEEWKIFISNNSTGYYSEIVCSCIHYATDKIRRAFCDKVLQEDIRDDFGKILVVQKCFQYATPIIKKKFSNKILREYNKETGPSIVLLSLDHAEEQVKINFSNRIFQSTDYGIFNRRSFRLFGEICFKFYTLNQVKQDFLKRVLHENNWKKLRFHIIIMCLNHSSINESEIFFKRVLRDSDWEKEMSFHIFSFFKDTSIDLQNLFSTLVFENERWRYMNRSIISYCLYFHSKNAKIPNSIHLAIDYIINNSKDTLISDYYEDLIKISFYNIPSWRQEVQKILKNWENEKVVIVYRLLNNFMCRPDEIQKICSEILFQWNRTDLVNSFIVISLGHPNLKDLAKQTAFKILQSIKNDNIDLFDLKETVIQIIENNIYPEWKF